MVLKYSVCGKRQAGIIIVLPSKQAWFLAIDVPSKQAWFLAIDEVHWRHSATYIIALVHTLVTLNHFMVHALHFSRIALELSFRALIEDNSCSFSVFSYTLILAIVSSSRNRYLLSVVKHEVI